MTRVAPFGAVIDDRLFEPHVAGPIVVATDGRDGAAGALELARLLVQRTGAELRAITALEPATALTPAPITPNGADHQLALRLRERRDRVDIQLRAAIGNADWPLAVRVGSPPLLIAREAAALGARFVIVGLGRHGLLERMVGRETALQVLRLSSVPVLAVPPNLDGLFRRIVAAVDFSRASIRAARLAGALLEPGGELVLAHVKPSSGSSPFEPEPWETAYERELVEGFERLAATIPLPRGGSVRTATRTGTPAPELLALASVEGADLIATGAHGHGFIERLVIGSVATRLVRRAGCAVLAVPLPYPSVDWSLFGGEERTRVLRERHGWTAALASFTRRNAGRRCRVEVDDPELGAQAQVRAFPLRGVDYDPTDDGVEIILGHGGAGRSHLGHTVRGATEIDILTGRDGTDRALRIVDGSSQTLLTFVS